MPAARRLRTWILVLLAALPAAAVAAETLPPDRPIAEVVDHYVDAKLREAGVTPAPQADDATLVRRLTLDLAGRIPTAAEAREFVAATDPAKRQQLIDRLIASPWFDRHLATELNALLRGHDNSGPDLRKYLLAAVRENRPWNRMFRELLGDGTDPLGPEQFVIARAKDLDRLTRDTSAMFFGINISCCECHTHPYVDTLTQDSFHGMKAFFSRTYEFQGKLLETRFGPLTMEYQNREGKKGQAEMIFLSGEKVAMPDPGVPDLAKAIANEKKEIDAFKKAFGKDKAYPPPAEFSPRQQLLEIVEKPENQTLMARSLVNQTWYRLFGQGLVMRIDQMQPANPSSHPELLEWLARDLIAHQWDMRRLIRGLVGSQAYGRSSEWTGKPPAPELFAVAVLRPLTPLQFGASLLVAGNGEMDTLAGAALEGKIDAIESQAKKFEGLLERPRSEGFEISIREPLAISNDPARIGQIGSALVPALQRMSGLAEQIEAATWAMLSRPPTAAETALLSEFVTSHSTLSPEEIAGLERAIAEHGQLADEARARVSAIDAAVTAPGNRGVIVPASSPGWKYIAAAELSGDAWLKPEFDDAAWKTGQAPVGHGSPLLTEKKGHVFDVPKGDVALRFAFEIDGRQWFDAARMLLQVAASESATVSVNGQMLDDDKDKKGRSAQYWNRVVDVSSAPLVPGRNTVAVRLKNAAGDAFFDMQLAILDEQQARERARQSATATAALPTVPKAHEVRGQAIASMVWALAAGSEFRFNH
jgi:hypothetical protein